MRLPDRVERINWVVQLFSQCTAFIFGLNLVCLLCKKPCRSKFISYVPMYQVDLIMQPHCSGSHWIWATSYKYHCWVLCTKNTFYCSFTKYSLFFHVYPSVNIIYSNEFIIFEITCNKQTCIWQNESKICLFRVSSFTLQCSVLNKFE